MMKPLFNRQSIASFLQMQTARIEAVMIRELTILAEQGVNIARQQHTYTDQTGNLTSSIGYELYVNGKSINKNFQPSEVGSESGEVGMAKGEALTAEIGDNGYFSLIFVAGMPYAEEVEARGKEVLSPAYLYVEKEMPKLKARIIRFINKQ